MTAPLQDQLSSPPEATVARRWLALVLLCVAQFMVVLDSTIVFVALPSIQADLNLSPESVQWIITAYTLVFGGCLLLGGRASDLLSRRRVFMTGITIFTLCSLFCGLAPTGNQLIIARAFQGFGAAILSPSALALLTTIFSDQAERNRALGIWGALGALGAAAGLLIGGGLTSALDWSWIFLINLPIGILALLVSPLVLPANRPATSGGSFDLLGAVTMTAGLLLLVYAVVQAGEGGGVTGLSLTLGGIGILLLAGFVLVEQRAVDPLVPLRIFQLRSLTTANTITFLAQAAISTMFLMLTLYMQQVLGYGALQTGLAFLPIALGVIVAAGIASGVASRRGVRPVMLTGLACVIVALLLLARAPVGGRYLVDLLPAYLIIAVGMGCTFLTVSISAFQEVRPNDAGLASGLVNTTTQLGGAIGVAVLATVAFSGVTALLGTPGATPAQIQAAQVTGFHAAFIGGAICAAIALALAALALPRQITQSTPAVEGGLL